ncbi:5-formyltetrahydrofolate cyclo-ligase [bacterium]|nr:MAG: 5-formyltetrahydrofolate cyclo-ligase [bacterium]
MNKEEAREWARQYRKKLSEEEHCKLSMMITYRLCYVYSFKEAYKYHIFIGSESKKEIITKPLIEVLVKSGRAVFAPKVTETAELSVHPMFSMNDLVSGSFGIEEPNTSASVERDFDAIIVPMLAADLKGGRVGYGKGFYDRFLAQSSGIKIGLVYDDCLFDEIDVHGNDIPMDVIITESRIIDLTQQK